MQICDKAASRPSPAAPRGCTWRGPDELAPGAPALRRGRSSVLIRGHAQAHVAVARAGAVSEDTARNAAIAPVLDGGKVREAQPSFRGGFLLVQRTRRP